jgi:RNA polymerase-binding transcription factor
MLAAGGSNTGLEIRQDPKGRRDFSDRSEALRWVLHELEAEILDRVRSLRMAHESEPVDDPEEAWRQNVERDLEVALAERAYETLRRIDEARVRLDEGTYGLCRRCVSSIPEERLRALPFAVLCRACQAREEEQAPPPRPLL